MLLFPVTCDSVSCDGACACVMVCLTCVMVCLCLLLHAGPRLRRSMERVSLNCPNSQQGRKSSGEGGLYLPHTHTHTHSLSNLMRVCMHSVIYTQSHIFYTVPICMYTSTLHYPTYTHPHTTLHYPAYTHPHTTLRTHIHTLPYVHTSTHYPTYAHPHTTLRTHTHTLPYVHTPTQYPT